MNVSAVVLRVLHIGGFEITAFPTRLGLFLFSKSEKYYYDCEAVKEPSKTNGTLRNRRTVWSINTEAFPDAHFAVFPTKLVEPCIMAGTEPNDVVLDPFLGSGTVGEACLGLNRRFVGVELNPEYIEIATKRIKRGLELRYEQRSFTDALTRIVDLAD